MVERSNDVQFKDRVITTLMDAVSLSASHIRPLNNALLAPEHAANYMPVRWRASRTPASTIGAWAVADGDPTAGRTPRSYRKSAIITVNKADIDAAYERDGGRYAVACEVGSALLVGVFPEGERFGEVRERDDRYAVAMGIGRSTLAATMGLWDPGSREFVAPTEDVSKEFIVVNRLIPPKIPRV